jgi:trigger factor
MKSLEELVNIATVQASDALYQRELEMMHQERQRMLQGQRLDMDTYLGYIGKTEEEFLEELRPNANERLTRYLVMRKLSQEEAIEVSDEEVQEEIEGALTNAGENAQQMRRTLSTDSAKENVRSSILNRKVLQHLVDIAQGTNGTALTPEASNDQESEIAEGSSTAEAEEQPEASTSETSEESN